MLNRDQLDKWTDQWDKAQQEGIFDEPSKPKVSDFEANSADFFGNWRPKEEEQTPLRDIDAKYWDNVYKMSTGLSDAPDVIGAGEEEEVLNEQTPVDVASKVQDKPLRELPDKDALGVKGAELGNTANPIHPWTRGKDQRPKITPNFIAGNELSELVNMKFNLYQLEGKLNAAPEFGSYRGDTDNIKKIQTQIDELKQRIDFLSNSLSPDFMQQELS